MKYNIVSTRPYNIIVIVIVKFVLNIKQCLISLKYFL